MGSLRSLNQVAMGVDLRPVEDLVAGRVRRFVWRRIDFDEEGNLSTEERPRPPGARCAFCEASFPLVAATVGRR